MTWRIVAMLVLGLGAVAPSPHAPVAAAQGFALEEAELRAFAKVALQAQDIGAVYDERRAAAPAEADALTGEEHERIATIIRGEPAIDVERYNAIAAAAERDPALRERIYGLMEALRSE